MHSKEWFGVGTRLLGVWQLIIAFRYSISVIAVFLEEYSGSVPLFSEVGSYSDYLPEALGHAFLGVALLRNADFLTAFAYAPRHEERGDPPADRVSQDVSRSSPESDSPREVEK